MKKIFDLNNPVWSFIGRLADFFVLSILWYICAALIIPLGAGSTALSYVSLSMADNTEGYITRSFFKAFRSSFKKASVIWLIMLCFGLVLCADFYWIFFGNPGVGIYFLPAAAVLAVIYIVSLAFIFPYLSKSNLGIKDSLLGGISLALKNFIPVFSYTILFVGIMLFGIFVFKAVLFVAPGLLSYVSSFIVRRIFMKYGIASDSSRNESEISGENN